MRDGANLSREQRAAELVRAHLVLVRGGAPFLSPIDSRLLIEWIEAGVPPELIISAIEEQSAKRTKSRVSTPFGLKSVRGGVKKRLKKLAADGGAPIETPTTPDQRDVPAIFHTIAASNEPLVRQAGERLVAIAQSPHEGIEEIVEVVRGYHEQAWEKADQEELLKLATEELADLREMLSKNRWEEAVLEVARDTLRQRTPLLSVQALAEAYKR